MSVIKLLDFEQKILISFGKKKKMITFVSAKSHDG